MVNAVLLAFSVLNLNGFHRHTLYSLPRPCQFLLFLIGLPVIICFTSGSGIGGDNGELSLGYLALKVMMGCPINTVRKLVE